MVVGTLRLVPVPVPQRIVLNLIHLHFGALLDLHGFLAELETRNGLLDLRVGGRDADDDARARVAS